MTAGAKGRVRLTRKNALDMQEVVKMYIKEMKLSSGLNIQRVFAAWNEASGAGAYTVRKFYREGKLFITLNSSVARSHLSFQKNDILKRMNDILADDELFTGDDPRVSFVQEIILK